MIFKCKRCGCKFWFLESGYCQKCLIEEKKDIDRRHIDFIIYTLSPMFRNKETEDEIKKYIKEKDNE